MAFENDSSVDMNDITVSVIFDEMIARSRCRCDFVLELIADNPVVSKEHI